LIPPEKAAGEGFAQSPQEAQDLPREATEPSPIEPSVTTPVPPVDPNHSSGTTTTRGFRVQLAALASAAEAESFRREAETRLGVGVHVAFESGLFKVRAGDFLDRGAAVALQTRARSYGYEAAWVVSTEVEVRRP
jgi:cell division septation protein DedD